MKLRNPILLRWAGFLASFLMRAWSATLRHLQHSVDGRPHPLGSGQGRCIYAVWHDSALSLLHIRTAVDVLISHHADGEFITQVFRALKVAVVLGSSTRVRAPAFWITA